ncbi:MAG: hypothetical protein R3E01_35155 [Pirellulaceae bacterium]|nr:hypothetical protein [Planctomycetales bacterium]
MNRMIAPAKCLCSDEGVVSRVLAVVSITILSKDNTMNQHISHKPWGLLFAVVLSFLLGLTVQWHGNQKEAMAQESTPEVQRNAPLFKAERIEGTSFLRYKIPGGWIVQHYSRGGGRSGFTPSSSITFVPDPDHVWDGTSLPN